MKLYFVKMDKGDYSEFECREVGVYDSMEAANNAIREACKYSSEEFLGKAWETSNEECSKRINKNFDYWNDKTQEEIKKEIGGNFEHLELFSDRFSKKEKERLDQRSGAWQTYDEFKKSLPSYFDEIKCDNFFVEEISVGHAFDSWVDYLKDLGWRA